MKKKIELQEFQEKYNLQFQDLSLLNQAFVHSSYTNKNNSDEKLSNERLEFLGDSILDNAIADFLSNYEEKNPAILRDKIVSNKNIAQFAKKLGLESLLLTADNNTSERLIASAFEALIGAIYINYGNDGYKKVKEFLNDNFSQDILSIIQEENLTNSNKNPEENLVFFGTTVLKRILTQYLFNIFPDSTEAELSKLEAKIRSNRNLANFAQKLGLKKATHYKKINNEEAYARSFRAMLGEIYLNQDYNKTKEFIFDNFKDEISAICQNLNLINAKRTLAKYTKKINNKFPNYILDKKSNPNEKIFYVHVKFNGKILGSGQADNQKDAEMLAAFDAIKKLNIL